MKTVISVKVDKDVRDKAKRVAKKLGIPLSFVVNMGLRQFAEEERLVIQSERAYKMSKALEKHIESIEVDLKKGKNMSPLLKTPEEVGKYLDSIAT
jgi:addiction module RelB/DinJ family antitoxin